MHSPTDTILPREWSRTRIRRLSPFGVAGLCSFVFKRRRKLLLNGVRWTIYQVGSELFIYDRQAGTMPAAYHLRLYRNWDKARQEMRWKVNRNDVMAVPGLADDIEWTGIFRSLKSPTTKRILLSRLVCAAAGCYIEWGNEGESPQLWNVVHHKNGNTLDDSFSNLRPMSHVDHEDYHAGVTDEPCIAIAA